MNPIFMRALKGIAQESETFNRDSRIFSGTGFVGYCLRTLGSPHINLASLLISKRGAARASLGQTTYGKLGSARYEHIMEYYVLGLPRSGFASISSVEYSLYC